MKTTQLQDIYIDSLYRHGARSGNAYDVRVYEALVKKGLVWKRIAANGVAFYRLTDAGCAWHEGRWDRTVAAALAAKKSN